MLVRVNNQNWSSKGLYFVVVARRCSDVVDTLVIPGITNPKHWKAAVASKDARVTSPMENFFSWKPDINITLLTSKLHKLLMHIWNWDLV